MQFSSIWPIDRAVCENWTHWSGSTLSGATSLAQSGPGSDDNEGVPHIPQSSSITGTSPSDCLVSWTLVGGWVLPLCRGEVSCNIAPADWASEHIENLLGLALLINNKFQCGF